MPDAPVTLSKPNPQPVLISLADVGPLSESLGKAHYSYGFAARAFTQMLEMNGVPVQVVVHPEQFKSHEFAEANGFDVAERLHLIFRSTAGIRPIQGAYNVTCFAWEFDTLKGDALADEYIVEDQVRMLKSCDEVWTPCRYTERVLRQHGVSRVRMIPAPIRPRPATKPSREEAFRELNLFESTPLVSSSAGGEAFFKALADEYVGPLGGHRRIIQAMKPGAKVFLTVCNPYDKRKNLASLIEGFLMATQEREDVVLLVKLVTSGMFEPPSGYLFHQIRVLFGNPHCIKEESVILMSGHLSDNQLDSLYAGCDYYLCGSIAEGQNLPLLEAMSAGCLPISTRNTAMSDYISDETAVVIDEGRYSGLISGLAGEVAGKRLSVDYADRYQIAKAIRGALALEPAAHARKVAAARAVVSETYSPSVVYEQITKALTSVRPDLAPAHWTGNAAPASVVGRRKPPWRASSDVS